MLRLPLIWFYVCCSFSLALHAAEIPNKTIDLLHDRYLDDFVWHLQPDRSLSTQADDAWSFDGGLRVSGKGWGYLRSKDSYRDYHLVLEYRWGERTWGAREDKARASGLFVHGHGQDAGFKGSWMQSIEAQLIEASAGNVFILGSPDDSDGTYSTRLSMTVVEEKDGFLQWDANGPEQAFPRSDGARKIHRANRDPEWVDVRGVRGKDGLDNPVGEWNRLEVICRGSNFRVLVNGKLVNQGTNAYPNEGYVGLLTEGAELFIRRWELWPLDAFTETWQPEVGPTNMGASETGESLLPRGEPWSPEESQAAWQIDGDYEMQLVAAEPVVNDPVDVVWDEHGRMFVVEMGDYPIPTEHGPLMSRIRLLKDNDNDGRMDEATTWMDQMDHVQGLTPYNGGLIATTRTAILFLKDTDGDDRADFKEMLYTSSDPRHSQLQVSSGRWGLDNAIHFNNGLDTLEIYPEGEKNAAMLIRGWDIRYDPRTKELTKITGKGQYGASFDDWGRRFFTTNRNPIQFAVLPAEAIDRNSFAALTQGYEDIQEPGAPVYPINVSHTTSASHLGTHTAACGLGVYRGHLMPELKGNIFVCDPTGQLVTRNVLVSNGSSFKAERVGDRREFLASSDEWARPVQIRNGPDGALYICDIYRRFIDHSKFFPDEFLKTNYIRAGLDHGRIWRLVPKGHKAATVSVLPKSTQGLVNLLAHENEWQRTQAQRLLIERQAMDAIPALGMLLNSSTSALGRLHALWTLEGLNRLSDKQVETVLGDSDPRLVESGITLSDPEVHVRKLKSLVTGSNLRLAFLAAVKLGSVSHPGSEELYQSLLAKEGGDDRWIRSAILSGQGVSSAKLLAALLSSSHASRLNQGLLREFSAEAAARGDWEGLSSVITFIEPGQSALLTAPLIEGLVAGLRRGLHRYKSLSALLKDPPSPMTKASLRGMQGVLDSAGETVLDRSNELSSRLAALPLIREQGMDQALMIASQLIDAAEPPEIHATVARMLSSLNRIRVTDFYFQNWDRLSPTVRRDALEYLAANETSAFLLMQKMKAGEINPALMPSFRRWWLTRRENREVAALAKELFGTINEDRAQLISDYMASIREAGGDPVRGRFVFEKAACATCHQLKGVGVEVGPTLADVRFKPVEALLADILDPNRAVEERWATYEVKLNNGESLSGLIASESASALEIKLPGGHAQTVARSEVAQLTTDGLSLMPVGLEGVLPASDMADLIAFLTTP